MRECLSSHRTRWPGRARRMGIVAAVGALLCAEGDAQLGDYLILSRLDDDLVGIQVGVFDRRMQEVPELAVEVKGPVGVASSPSTGLWLTGTEFPDSAVLLALTGDAWLPLDDVPHDVAGMAASADGRVLRCGGQEMSAAAADGSLLWIVPTPEGMFDPRVAVGIGSQAWIAGGVGNPGFSFAALWEVDLDDGAIGVETALTKGGWFDSSVATDLHPLADGSVWLSRGAYDFEPMGYFGAVLEQLLAGRVVASMPVGNESLMTFKSDGFVIDHLGRLLVVDSGFIANCICVPQPVVVASDPAVPGPPVPVHDFGSNVWWLQLGPTGRELFAVLSQPGYLPPFASRLARLNLDTGTRSTVPLPGQWASAFPPGDATGWTYASAVDTAGDADGDGVTNGAETAAGSDPYDPLSRPDGPFIGLSFTAEHAIVLTIRDSDGLRDPDEGLDFGSLQLLWNGGMDVLPVVWPFITSITLNPDWTEGTVIFGGLPLAENLKWRLEARVADLTGAVGWDWQITPPGDL